MQLRGIFAALTTPFDDSGELRLDLFERNLASYESTELAGYLVLGSSAEAIYLTTDEKRAVLRAAANVQKIKLAGTGEESLRATVEMTRYAASLGYAAAVVRTPHYYKKSMTPAALIGFYRDLADTSPIPIILYNIPPLTGIDLTLDATIALASHPNIVGLKESSGNTDKLVRLMAAGLPNFAVLVGGASTLYPSLCAGASGAILALAAAAPEACLAIENAYRAGNHARALAAQQAVLRACAAFEALSIAGLKGAVDVAGDGARYGGPPRKPQLPLTAAQKQALAEAFAGLRIAVPAS
ncbi:MAG TPA: dihydrodipicolinate synthase family protein [Terriglobales bacterium]|nr:dihydrodipicolinate synthase family protein [Terriglobales bacterium]